ncbi:MAG: hypothetical protein KatS3mg038_0887 [Candidatus Kapaibacterium sp.]|nr:MAG: hypothetical protein KatS3mg038_0887 [Candidatus Kapabacteria bacterium]
MTAERLMERMITIGQHAVDIEIFTEPFACDIVQCKGACCTIPDCFGAPLEQEEIAAIERVLPRVLPMLSDAARAVIATHGIAEQTPSGQWVTTTVDGRECVFAIVRDGIARCALHRAWEQGESDFPKPLSCHLFPVRQTTSGAFVYERYSECHAAQQLGKRRGQTVYGAVRQALERAFGAEWIAEADAVSMSITGAEERCRNSS